jgi:hypothetical protein
MGGDLPLYRPDTAWSTSNTIQDHIQLYISNTWAGTHVIPSPSNVPHHPCNPVFLKTKYQHKLKLKSLIPSSLRKETSHILVIAVSLSTCFGGFTLQYKQFFVFLLDTDTMWGKFHVNFIIFHGTLVLWKVTLPFLNKLISEYFLVTMAILHPKNKAI